MRRAAAACASSGTVDGVIYLDHAATSPLGPEVAEAMAPWLVPGAVGNASSLHAAGRRARTAVEDARDRVAEALAVTPLEVLFTSGGTEADNTALKGLVWAAPGPAAIVTTAVEHPAVLDTARWLGAHHDVAVTVVGVDGQGLVDPDRFLSAVDAQVASGRQVVASVMVANNELGTIQPLDTIGPALADRGVALHTDAVQAVGRIPLRLDRWQPTALALSAHKFNGPTGIGVLLLRRDAVIHQLLHGGGQERGVRSGTLAVAGIVGLGAAAVAAVVRQPDEHERLRDLRDSLADALTAVEGVTPNGHRADRLPSHLHVAVAGVDAESMLLGLDRAGVACSTGSACQSGAAERSHVLDAIGADPDAAHLRFSLGTTTTAAEITVATVAFESCVMHLRASSPRS